MGVSVEREFICIENVARLAAYVGAEGSADMVCQMMQNPARCENFGPGCVESPYVGTAYPSREFLAGSHGSRRLGLR
jgi:hypothetical protein